MFMLPSARRCRLSPLVTSDLIDEDIHMHKRSRSMSATIVGSVALLAKPSQSIAPALGYSLLSAENKGARGEDMDIPEFMSTLCGMCLIVVPVVSVIMQLFIWEHYTLRGKRLSQVKRSVAAASALGGQIAHEV